MLHVRCRFESLCHHYMIDKVLLLLAPNPFPSMNPTQPIPSHLIFWLYIYEPVIACLYYRHHSTPCFSLWFITFLVAFQNSQHTKRDRFFCQKKYQNPCRALYQSSTAFPLTGGTSTFTPLQFWSLEDRCRWVVHGPMWGFPEIEFTCSS